MSTPGDDPSIRHEPFMAPPKDGPDSVQDEPALSVPLPEPDAEEQAHHNVWDEPATQMAGIGRPAGSLDYAMWYRWKVETTPATVSWAVVAGLVVVGGPLALYGVVMPNSTQMTWSLFMIVVFGPALEEVLKATAVLVVLERRPYLFQSAGQLMVALAASAACFATIENLLYLNVYIDEPKETLAVWRWTTCTALHIGATMVGGLGIQRMWRRSRKDFSKPRMEIAFPYLVAAVIVHGGYNLFATGFEAIFQPF